MRETECCLCGAAHLDDLPQTWTIQKPAEPERVNPCIRVHATNLFPSLWFCWSEFFLSVLSFPKSFTRQSLNGSFWSERDEGHKVKWLE